MAKKNDIAITSTEYIAMLKDLMTPQEWKLIRSLHKKNNASKAPMVLEKLKNVCN